MLINLGPGWYPRRGKMEDVQEMSPTELRRRSCFNATILLIVFLALTIGFALYAAYFG